MKKILILALLLIPTTLLVGQEQNILLTTYRTMALEYNHDLKAAEKNIAASIDLIKMAKADTKPKVMGGANASYIGNPTELSLGNMAIQGDNFQYGAALYLQQPIYAGGRLLESIRIAQLQNSMSEHQTQAIRSGVCYQTDIIYWSSVARGEMVTIAEDFYTSISSLAATIKERVDVGLVDKQDLLMVEVKQNEAELQLSQAKTNFTTGRMALNSIIGIDLHSKTEIDKNVPTISHEETLLTHDKNSRPEIALAEDRVGLAKSTMKLNDSKYRPQLNIGADGGYSSPGYDFTPDLNFNYRIQLQLSIPIFEWGKRSSQKQLSSHKIAIATDNLNKTIDNVNLEVESAKVALAQTIESVNIIKSSLSKAIENENRAIERYNEGKSSIIEVIEAQIYRQTSQINYVQAKVTAQNYYSELLRVLNAYS